MAEEETRERSLNALKLLFGDNIGSKISEILTGYVTEFENMNVVDRYPQVTTNAVIDSILWYIEMYNPTKQVDDPVVNAGKLAYNRVIRKYNIYLIFIVSSQEAKKASKVLFNIIAECLANKDTPAIMYARIDEFIKEFVTKNNIRYSPALLHDAEAAREQAETDARARGPQSYGQGLTATLVELRHHLGRGLIPSSSSSDPSQHTFGNVDNPLRERILHIEKERRDVIVDLNDPTTRIAVFNRLIETGPPFYSQQEVMDEINQIVTERRGLPPSVTFPPGIFTPTQEKARIKAGKLGWSHAMGLRESPYFFPDKPGGAAAAPDNRGGNKRIKSKRISKMRYKKSKKRSNRRRRRYSYKK
jgi:hypothetical protein